MNWWKILKEDHWEEEEDDYYWKMWIETYNKGGF